MEINETRELWDRIAHEWDIQVGDEGDSNRILNSDPTLWKLAGKVEGLRVLDAGCGTGYLLRKLRDRGAHVIGIDFSQQMCEIARTKSPDLDIRVDSCSVLETVHDNSVDMVISNYVLMDTPNLEETMKAFSRVLNVNGIAILVFSTSLLSPGSGHRGGRPTGRLSLGLSLLRTQQVYRPSVGTFHFRLHLVPSPAFRLLESV